MKQEFLAERLTRSYQTLGDLTLEFHDSGETSDYRRELDLERALSTTTFRVGKNRFRRTVFSSHPDEVLVVRVEVELTWEKGRAVQANLLAYLSERMPSSNEEPLSRKITLRPPEGQEFGTVLCRGETVEPEAIEPDGTLRLIVHQGERYQITFR